MEHTREAVEQTAPALSQQEIVAEATNAPELAKDEFVLGGRKFKVVSLGYKQYIQFLSKLSPVLDAISSKVKSGIGLNKETVHVPGLMLAGMSEFDSNSLFKFCADELPAMAAIVCNMEKIAAKDESDLVTTEWIEDVAEDPFALIDIVLRQINKNQIIAKFASFFAQVLPMFLGIKSQAK